MKQAFDCECYPNYFSVCLVDLDTDKVRMFEKFNDREIAEDSDLLEDIMLQSTFIGFNSMRYDDFMVSAYLSGLNNEQLYELSQALVADKDPLLPWSGWRKYAREFGVVRRNPRHSVDIMNIPKGFHSLKIYAARIGFPKLQELPIPWWKVLTEEDLEIMRPYNANDCYATIAMYNDQLPQIKLRNVLGREYRIDMLSKSDAQIAEAVIKSELKTAGIEPVRGESVEVQDEYVYTPPKYLSYNHPILAQRLDAIANEYKFTIGKDGKMKPPRAMSEIIKIGGSVYQMGVGGLHSKEAKRSVVAGDDEYLCDIDVASYYPGMIRNERYAPTQYDADTFLSVYGGIVDKRLAAKASGDKTTADSLKIVINSSFGGSALGE